MSDPGVEYRLYLDQFRHDVSELKTLMTGAGDESEKQANKLDSTMKKVGAGMLAYFTIDAIKAAGEEIITLRAEFEKYEAVLTNSLGSQKDAVDAMDQLQQFAANTPFQLNNLTDSFVKLVGQGFQPTMKEMTNLGDLASSKAKGFDMLAEALLDAEMGENERLKEFGIKAQKNGDIIKYTFKGVTTEVKNNSESIREYILSLGKMEGVAGSMAAISKTLGGAMSNAADSTDNLYNVIGSKLSPSLIGLYGNYSKLIGKIAEWVKDSPVQEMEAERNEVNALTFELQSAELPLERRNEIYERLSEIAPDVVEGINQENINYGKLNTNLQKYNDLAIQRIALKKLEIELVDKRDELAELENKRYEQNEKVFKLIEKKGEEYRKIMLDTALTVEEKINQVYEKAYDKRVKFAEYGASMTSDPILNAIDKLNRYKRQYAAIYDELIKESAEHQKRLDEAIKNGLNPNEPDPKKKKTQSEVDDEAEKAFKKWKANLKAQEKAYKNYEAVKSEISNEEADKLYADLLEKAATYQAHLKNLLNEPLSKQQKAVVAVELLAFRKKDKTKTSKKQGKEESTAYYEGVIEATKTYEEKLGDIYLKYQIDRMLLEKNGQTDRIAMLDEQLEADIYAAKKSNDLYAWLFKSLENYSRKELKNFIAKIREKLALVKVETEYRIALEKKLAEAEDKLSGKLADNLNDVATIFGELSSLAAEFNDELAAAFDTASQLASAGANIAAGFAPDGNPVQAIQGIIQGVTAIAKLINEESDNSKEILEDVSNAVVGLKDDFEKLSDAINDAFGVDKIRAFNDAVYSSRDAVINLTDLAPEIKKATEDALDQESSFYEYFAGSSSDVNALARFRKTWTDIAEDYGEGSKEFYAALLNSGQLPEDVRLLVEDIIENYDYYIDEQARLLREQMELLTGLSVGNLGDEIVQMFKDGEIAAADFTAKFEELMKNAIIEIFKQKIIMTEMEGWYDYLTELMDDNGDGTIDPTEGLTPEEKELLRGKFNEATDAINEGWDVLTEIFPELAALQNPSASTSKAGAVSNVITEETAGVFTGHVANMRVNMVQVVSIANRQLNTLNKIEGHTRRLENIETHLSEMNDSLGGLRSYGS